MKGMKSVLSGQSVISNRNGFVTVYVAMVLAVALLLSGSVYLETQRYHDFRMDSEAVRVMDWMEILTVNRIKEKMRNYKEKDEEYSLNGVSVIIRYEGSTAYISISCQGMTRNRTLVFDDVEECISEYY
jgi:hypothetical protein